MRIQKLRARRSFCAGRASGSLSGVDEKEEKRLWVEETERWLQSQGYPPDSNRRAWLEAYYDHRPEAVKQSERDDREMEELRRRVTEQFGRI